MIQRSTRLVLSGLAVATAMWPTQPAHASPCDDTRHGCQVEVSDGSINVSAEFSSPLVAGLVAESAAEAVDYVWRLRRPCEISAEHNGACSNGDFRACPEEPGRVIEFLSVERRPVVRPDGTAVAPVPPQTPPGSEFGSWREVRRTCIDITALDPAPTPAEVYSYFRQLPLPPLTTRQQPPGTALVGLPVIFFTDQSTSAAYSLDIRGYTVAITATATTFTWHTGDGTTLTTTDAGHPYPDQTITHDYRAGTYTASLTTTWTGTYTVDDGPPLDVDGTTTTDGTPTTFTVVEARAVLTDPHD